MYTQRQCRIRFFRDNAGYASPPGQMMCAAQLADAEKRAEDLNWGFEWQPDNDCDFSDWDCDPPEYVEGCVLTDEYGNVLASLWGIADASESYRRVVEAELALEASGAVDEARFEYEMAR